MIPRWSGHLLESPGTPGAFFYSLRIGGHRTRRQVRRWSVGHHAPCETELCKSRPVAPRDVAAPGKVKGAPKTPAGCEVRCRYHRGSGSVDVMAWDPRQKNRAPLLRDAIGDSDLINVRFSNRPSGSSTFRLSATPVSMSLTGSRFSSDSAPRPFHHGVRRRGGTIFGATLPSR